MAYQRRKDELRAVKWGSRIEMASWTAEKMVQPRWMDESMVGWMDWLTRREGYWGANLALQSPWGSCLAVKMVQLILMGAERAGWMVDLIHWELETELTKVLLYPWGSNLVGLKACQRRKDCPTDFQLGSWKLRGGYWAVTLEFLLP